MSNEPQSKAPAAAVADWQRPPFEPGNLAAAKHGAQSDRLVEPRAYELVPQILEANPHLDEIRDGPGVYRYCQTLARLERVYRWLAEQEDSVFGSELRASRASKDPSPHGVFERLERWESQADRAEERLGISPMARAKLGLDHQRASLNATEIAEREAARKRLDARADALSGPEEASDEQ